MPAKDSKEKWKNILTGTIGGALEDLAVLTVETHVVGTDENDVIVRIDTRIEQVTGDISNTISESAFTRDYGTELRAFHETQRAAAVAILERNVKAVGDLVQLIRSIRAADKAGNEGGGGNAGGGGNNPGGGGNNPGGGG